MNEKVLKIAFVVHGRFQAFELALELIKKGQEVRLFTNYPKWAVKRFGIYPANVRSFWPHVIISRAAWLMHERLNMPYPEKWLHRMFGRWAAREVLKESWDVIHCWSGISEEILLAAKGSGALKILMRCSSHISAQERLLKEEEKKAGVPIDKPSAWMMEREKREYALADYIRTLSGFSYASFIEEGIDPKKMLLIPAAAPIESFRPRREVADNRYKRIAGGEPLRILYVGTISFRKGIRDMAVIGERLKKKKFRFRAVGPVAKEAKDFKRKLSGFIEFIPSQPRFKLPGHYAWADIFIFPTLEDGHAQVLAQAQASGLPILTTTNCQGPDVIVEDRTGWVLPIRSPESFIKKLQWYDSHRNELAGMAKNVYENHKPKNWNEVAGNFIDICTDLTGKDK